MFLFKPKKISGIESLKQLSSSPMLCHESDQLCFLFKFKCLGKAQP